MPMPKQAFPPATRTPRLLLPEAGTAPYPRYCRSTGDARRRVGWAYRSEVARFPTGDGRFHVVAHLDAAKEGGVPSEDVKEKATGAMNEAKGKLYAERMNGANLDDIAAAVGETVRPTDPA